jgi:CHAT domain-containing protein
LGDHAFVQFQLVDDQIVAVVLAAGSRTLHVMAPMAAVRPQLDRLVFALRRTLTGFGTASGRASASASISRIAVELDRLLLAPLASQVGDRTVVVTPSNDLALVPWSLLPSCRGRTVHVTPSATLWCSAHDRRAAEGHGSAQRVLAVAGPGLPGAEQEVAEVLRLHAGATSLTGIDARVDTVLRSLTGSTLVHLAAHGNLRHDNPLFSSLALEDGPLTAYELERVPAPPRDVLLPACGSGAGQTVVAEETLGLAWTLIGAGTSAVVAPLLAIPDQATGELMRSVHVRLAAGAGLADALAAAQEDAHRSGSVGQLAVAGCFVSFGA